MTSKKAAELLKKSSEILVLFGEMPIEKALDEIYLLCSNNVKSDKTKDNIKNRDELSKRISNELVDELSKMSSDELKSFLFDNELFQSKEALMFLADKLKITSSNSKRYSAENLRHYIVTYFERSRIDDIIKKDRQ